MRRSIVPSLLLAFLLASSSVQASKFFRKHGTNEVRAEAEAGHALVYVFRPARGQDTIKTWAFVNDELLMVSKERAYSVTQVPAGTHLFWSKAENTSALELQVEAGRTYYLKLAVHTGFNKARARLVVVDETDAEKYFEKCSWVESTEEGRLRAAEIVENRLRRAQKKAARKNRKKI